MDSGIIGGADGPTAIFLSSDGSLYVVVAILVLCIAVAGFIIRRKRRKLADE